MKSGSFILQGKFRKQKVPLPSEILGHSQITSQKIKEAAFQLIANREKDANKIILWDIFSGSGQIGFEAISRGFLKTIFCELDKQRLNNIKGWLYEHQQQEHSMVHQVDSLRVFKKIFTVYPLDKPVHKEDSPLLVIYADPPYSLKKNNKPVFEVLAQEYIHWKQQSIYKKHFLLVQAPSEKRWFRKKRTSFEPVLPLYQKVYRYNNNMLLSID